MIATKVSARVVTTIVSALNGAFFCSDPPESRDGIR